MDLGRYTALFVSDSRDQLQRATTCLLAWERDPRGPAPVDELFRAFHSLKGSAAAMGYESVAQLAHATEQVLEVIRRGELAGSRAVVSLLLKVVDVLETEIEAAVHGAPGRGEDTRALIEALERMAGSATPSTVQKENPEPVPETARVPRARRSRAIRIGQDRLDELMSQIGELVVARNRLATLVGPELGTELGGVSGRIGTLVRGLQATVLRARLSPLHDLFERFPRAVRDLGVELGKSVRLELSGEGIELDRAILEELVDPILHLLRNAVDHGIEDPTERVRAGKPAEGVITLSAERRRDVVELRVEDDGRGVNRDRVLARARQLGLFAPGAEVTLDDAGLLRVLAHPGFSLKAGVTQVSGRGVGIDAAVAAVRAAGGRVSLESELGRGTRFTLTLPLTAAIQRVLLVGVEQERCAVPFGLVSEAVRAPLLEPGRFSFRGESVPLVDLRDAMALPSSRPDRKRQVLMLDWGGETHRGALAVDTLLGQHDVVVERIEEPAGMPRWLSAATILPDGSPAFLLDPTALF